MTDFVGESVWCRKYWMLNSSFFWECGVGSTRQQKRGLNLISSKDGWVSSWIFNPLNPLN